MPTQYVAAKRLAALPEVIELQERYACRVIVIVFDLLNLRFGQRASFPEFDFIDSGVFKFFGDRILNLLLAFP